jgi:hypothetical protein
VAKGRRLVHSSGYYINIDCIERDPEFVTLAIGHAERMCLEPIEELKALVRKHVKVRKR